MTPTDTTPAHNGAAADVLSSHLLDATARLSTHEQLRQHWRPPRGTHFLQERIFLAGGEVRNVRFGRDPAYPQMGVIHQRQCPNLVNEAAMVP